MPRSSLLPDNQMLFSPALASTIGLEEAIFLQQLDSLTQGQAAKVQQGFDWFTLSRSALLDHFSFWNSADLHRISRNLVEKAVILVSSPPIHSCESFTFAFNESHRDNAHPHTTSRHTPRPDAPASRAVNIRGNWSPTEDILQLLQLNHQIPRQFALEQVDDFILYWKERGQASHAWENKFRSHVLAQWRRTQNQTRVTESQFEVSEPKALDRDWSPSEDALEILARNGVDDDFIQEAIPEFILYWRERGSAPKELNSRFIQHIRIQWARYTSAIKHSTEPTRIPPDWTPSRDVYDILRLSHIDRAFADELLPEFIVFWKDSNQLQTSWNSKFLQHVKYHWAKRHQLNTNLPGGKTRDRSLSDDLNDTSWA
jgi:hypothetical protein